MIFPDLVEMCQCFGGNRFLLVQGKVLRFREWMAKMEAVIARGSRCGQSVCLVITLHQDLACLPDTITLLCETRFRYERTLFSD